MKYHVKTLYIIFKFKRKKNKKLKISNGFVINGLHINVSPCQDEDDFVSLLFGYRYKKKIIPYISFEFPNSNYWLNEFCDIENHYSYDPHIINFTTLKKNYREILSMFKKYIEAY